MIGHRYRDKVFEPYIRLFRDTFTFYLWRIIVIHMNKDLFEKSLESGDTDQIPWPTESPDLNSIENIWDYLEKAGERRIVNPWRSHYWRSEIHPNYIVLLPKLWLTSLVPTWKHILICVCKLGEIHSKFVSLNFFLSYYFFNSPCHIFLQFLLRCDVMHHSIKMHEIIIHSF